MINYIKKLYNGRIGRLNFFLGMLFFEFSSIILIGILFLIPAILIGLIHPLHASPEASVTVTGVYISVTLIVMLLCWSTLIVRRFHDIGVSGYYAFLCLILPISGFIILFLYFKKGTNEINKYGDLVVSNKFFKAIFPVKITKSNLKI